MGRGLLVALLDHRHSHRSAVRWPSLISLSIRPCPALRLTLHWIESFHCYQCHSHCNSTAVTAACCRQIRWRWTGRGRGGDLTLNTLHWRSCRSFTCRLLTPRALILPRVHSIVSGACVSRSRSQGRVSNVECIAVECHCDSDTDSDSRAEAVHSDHASPLLFAVAHQIHPCPCSAS